MPNAAVRPGEHFDVIRPEPVESQEDPAEARWRETLEQSQLIQAPIVCDGLDRGPLDSIGPPPPEIQSIEYDFEPEGLNGESMVQTIRVTTTTSAASTSEDVQNWIQVTAMKLMQARVWSSWATSATSTSSTIDLWPVSTSATGIENGWLADQCTAAANAVWRMQSWQSCEHTKVRWTPTVYQQAKETPEQIVERRAKEELARQQREREAAERRVFTDTAKSRARRLLFSMLNPQQQKQLDEKNYFDLTVYSQDGKSRVYRIEHGYAGNVKLLGADGQPVKRYCIHADSRLPYEDQMLAQKLLLESNEQDFLKIANMTQLRAA